MTGVPSASIDSVTTLGNSSAMLSMLETVRSGEVMRSLSMRSLVRVARGRTRGGRARESHERCLFGLQGSTQLDLPIQLRLVSELPLQGGDLAFKRPNCGESADHVRHIFACPQQ